MTRPSSDHEREPLALGAAGWLISGGVFVFGAWGYLTRGGAFSADSLGDFLQSTGAGFAFLVALGGIMQFVGALGVRAIKRSQSFDLEGSKKLSLGMAGAGGAFTAYTLHNAFDATGMLEGSFETAALAWIVSGGVAFCELASWWIDESHKSEAHARRAEDEARRLLDAQTRRPPAFSWSDILALDNGGLEIMAAVDPESFQAVRSKIASANAKANHAGKALEKKKTAN